jgi:hypothetical protein
MFYIILILISIPLGLLNGFILSQMWSNFIVPLGITPISAVHAWGVIIIASCFHTPKTEKTDKKETIKLALLIESQWLFAWGITSILSFFM